MRSFHLPLYVLMILLTAAGVASAIEVGNGLSNLPDAKAAGAEAATQAKAALGDTTPKLVLVFDGPKVEHKDKDEMLEGVASVFDRAIVYGCNGYAPLTQDGNDGAVAVMAVGGDVNVTVAAAEVEGKEDEHYVACGKQIGETLKQAAAVGEGKLLLLFGACHIPANDKLVDGVCSVLGEKFPIAGGAAFQDVVYQQARPITGINLGILLTGDFQCGFAVKKDMSPQGLIDSAGEAFTEALGDAKEKAAVVFAFDCGGRRGKMKADVPKELAAMKTAAGDVPIFGFYGSGEIGCPDNDSAPCGVGYSISACAVSKK
jgi:hypothetical protein